jgi:flagellar motor switch protein FliN
MSESVQINRGRFVSAWAAAMGVVLSQISGATWNPEVVESPAACDGSADVRLQFSVEKALSGAIDLGLSFADASSLVTCFTGDDAPAEWSSGQMEGLEELFRQFAGQFSATVKPIVGEVQLRMVSIDSSRFSAHGAAVVLTDAKQKRLKVTISMDDQLLTQLDSQQRGHDANASPLVPANLDLLMDVELAVTLRFGQRHLLLQDILELQSGSVIELDREIQDPVELLLDGRVLARGNVVVVDGNYGLRVSEIVSATPER